MQIKELCKKSHQIAIEKGFWEYKECLGQLNRKGEIVHNNKCCNGTKSSNLLKHRNISELLMLVVSELGEACEALRKGNSKSEHIPKFSAVEEELADAVIRIADMSQALNYRLQEAIVEKLKFNQKRSFKHDKLF